MKPLPRLAILISGRGSNMQALLQSCMTGQLAASVALVASNNPAAGGLLLARSKGIETAVVDHRDFPERSTFENRLADLIESSGAQYILLAGFMRILGKAFTDRFQGRILNIHPSLLPAYRGVDTHARAIANGDHEAGASVHFVTEHLDGGPVIVQGRVSIDTNDTAGTLAAKVLKVEHRIYPLAAKWLIDEDIKLQNTTCLWLGDPLQRPHLWTADTRICSDSGARLITGSVKEQKNEK